MTKLGKPRPAHSQRRHLQAHGEISARRPTRRTRRCATFIAEHPGHLPEGLLCAATGAEFGPILRGEKDAVQVLFSGPGRGVARSILRRRPVHQPLDGGHRRRGAGSRAPSAGRTRPAHPRSRRRHRRPRARRCCRCSSAACIPTPSPTSPRASSPAANQKLAAFPEVEYKIFDLEKPAPSRASSRAPSTSSSAPTCSTPWPTCAPRCGTCTSCSCRAARLVFMDVATPQLWTESVFGLTSGWWRFTDRDLRPEQPLLQRAQWESALRESGFAETASLAGPARAGRAKARSASSPGRRGDAASVHAESGATDAPVETSWLIFADESGTRRTSSIARVTSAGARCRVVRRGNGFRREGRGRLHPSRGGAGRLEAAFREPSPRTRRRSGSFTSGASMRKRAATRTMRSWASTRCSISRTRWKARCPRPSSASISSRAARSRRVATWAPPPSRRRPSIGLFRVILNEHPNFACRGIDLPPAAVARPMSASLWSELLPSGQPSAKSPSAARRATCSASTAACPRASSSSMPRIPLRLESRERGLLDTCASRRSRCRRCGPGEVLDRGEGRGHELPRRAQGARALSRRRRRMRASSATKSAAIVTAVGEGVTHVAAGRPRLRSRRLRPGHADARARRRCAAACRRAFPSRKRRRIPVVFMTAWYALKNVARMQGRRDASSSTRARAASAWRRSRSRITSAPKSSPPPAARPSARCSKTLGVKHVIDSRRGDFAEAVMELTERPRRGRRAQRARRRGDPDGPLLPRGVRPLHRDRQTRHLPELAHPALVAAAQRLVPRRRDGRRLRRRRSADARAAGGDRRARGEGRAHAAARSAPSRPAASMRPSASWRAASTSARSSSPSPRHSSRGAANRSLPAFAVKADGCYLITGGLRRIRQSARRMARGMRRASPRAHAAAAAPPLRRRSPLWRS